MKIYGLTETSLDGQRKEWSKIIQNKKSELKITTDMLAVADEAAGKGKTILGITQQREKAIKGLGDAERHILQLKEQGIKKSDKRFIDARKHLNKLEFTISKTGEQLKGASDNIRKFAEKSKNPIVALGQAISNTAKNIGNSMKSLVPFKNFRKDLKVYGTGGAIKRQAGRGLTAGLGAAKKGGKALLGKGIGGPLMRLLGLLVAVLMKSEPIQKLIGRIMKILAGVIKNLEPVLDILGDVLGNVIGVIIKALSPLLLVLIKVLLPPLIFVLGLLLVVLGYLIKGLAAVVRVFGGKSAAQQMSDAASEMIKEGADMMAHPIKIGSVETKKNTAELKKKNKTDKAIVYNSENNGKLRKAKDQDASLKEYQKRKLALDAERNRLLEKGNKETMKVGKGVA